MIKKYLILGLIGLIGFSSCVSIKTTSVASSQSTAISDAKLYTAVWMQQSAEYKALCLQAYQLAELRLSEILTHQRPVRPFAIITDIDETCLDNSPNAIHQALQGKDFEPASWDAWVSKAAADTIPGALSFFQQAAAKGVEVFYVTNRNSAGRAATLKNLQHFHFPNADEAHLMTSTGSSSKQARRDNIAATHSIALLLGDNLADFSPLFENHPTAKNRTAAVMQLKEQFGKRFIVLPNPNYGDWENAIYQYQRLSPEDKEAAFRKAGTTY